MRIRGWLASRSLGGPIMLGLSVVCRTPRAAGLPDRARLTRRLTVRKRSGRAKILSVRERRLVSNVHPSRSRERCPTTRRTAPTAARSSRPVRWPRPRPWARPPALEAQDAPAKTPVLPKRKLGKTGVEITMLEMGTGALRERGVLDRLLRLAYASGVRTFDTAKIYGTEPGFKKWFEQAPEVRKQIVLVTKDKPARPRRRCSAMLDQRLAALGTDYVDLFFIHGLGDDHSARRRHRTSSRARNSRRRPRRSASRARRSSSASRPTTRTAPRSSRRRPRAGSSTRSCSSTPPGSTRTRRSTRRSTPATSKGIGLISMKQIAGQFPGDGPR